ncbi:helix-turn-helix domain-containing protein [Streptomyces sp. NPDC002232]|uniref:helix-turn-helix domain-containing protein n=1 Tax=Streptomyces sp. NPDC002232 TaxID=3364640 RepID=UPI0036982E51
MTEVARTRGNAADVERGEVPEAVALGGVLKELFARLGVSQSQYAYRVHLDKSAVSRYLSGRRVAPQEFIDRLVRETEEHLGAPLQLEAREALRTRRLEALRVCDPEAFRLEGLRDELARSRRDTERAHRNIEALHALLDRKEAQARDVADDLTRLRLDWGAERAALARAGEDLRREVERLREDLRDAEHLRQEAERHGEELRETVLRLEEELSRGASGAGALPLDAFMLRQQALWEEEDDAEAARHLTEAAWSRPLDDVAALLHWLDDFDARNFAADVARLRPLADVLEFAPEVARKDRTGVRRAWVSALAPRIAEGNAAAVYQALGGTEGDRVLAEAVRKIRNDSIVVELVVAALAGSSAPAPLRALSRTLTEERGPDRCGLRVTVGLAQAGRHDVAAHVVAAAVKLSHVDFRHSLGGLHHVQIRVLFDLVTWLDDTAVMTAFTKMVILADEPALGDRLFTMMSEQDRLSLVDRSVRDALRDVVAVWRRSRGQ